MYNQYAALERYKRRKLSRVGSSKMPNVAENINRIQTTSEGRMRRAGVPASSMVAMQRSNELAASKAYNETTAPIYLAEERKKDILKDQIAELGVKSDAFEAEEERKKKEAKKKRNASLVKMGATAIGAIAAPFTGGASLPIASGLGDMAAGAGFGQGNIDRVGDADYMDEQLIASGLQNTVSSVMSEIKMAGPRKLGETLSGNAEMIAGLDKDQITKMRETISMYSLGGNYDEANEFLKTFLGTAGTENKAIKPPMPTWNL